MNPESPALKNALKKREAELQKLIQQMKQDNLHSSSVFKKLETELDTLKDKLTATDTIKR